MERKFLIEKILSLKEEKGYKILAHNYQIADIQDIADITGDSLQLAELTKEINSDKILFAGVDFMAETIKILNPQKKVIVPVKSATCPMANSLSRAALLEFKKKYPGVPVVLYVNSTAECKAEADYLCTSANAVDVVAHIDSQKVLFGPDKNLASYVAQHTGKKVIPIPGESGYCYVHNRATVKDVKRSREMHPNAKIIVHPECPREVRALSDYIGSTGQMLKFPKNNPSNEFIIGTDIGMIHKLKKNFPNIEFYPLKKDFICHNMKKNTLEGIYESLDKEQFEVSLDPKIIEKARTPIRKMFEIMEKV